MEKEFLQHFLEWLITPQDEKEEMLFKESNLIDDYISVKNRIPEMDYDELIKEINSYLWAFGLQIDQSKD